MPFFEHDGLRFHYRESGHGPPLVFQHGLGGDVSQPFGLYRPKPGIRLIGFDMRGHGETRPLGDLDKLTIPSMAEDLIGFSIISGWRRRRRRNLAGCGGRRQCGASVSRPSRRLGADSDRVDRSAAGRKMSISTRRSLG